MTKAKIYYTDKPPEDIQYLEVDYLNIYGIANINKLGIGTTDPSVTLDINSNFYNTVGYGEQFHVSNGKPGSVLGDGTSPFGYFFAGYDTKVNRARIGGYNYNTGQYAHLIINEGGSGGYGNVGIGITQPNEKLHVQGGIRASGTLITGSPNSIAIDYSSAWGNTTRIVSYGPTTGSSYIPIAFLTANSDASSAIERVRIATSGNVGIGITNPTQTLHVQGNARLSGGFYDSGNNVGASGQILSSTGSGTLWINANTTNVGSASSVGINLDSTNTTRYITFTDRTSGNGYIQVDTDITYNPSTNILSTIGSVGIGTTNPQAKLQVYTSSDGGDAVYTTSNIVNGLINGVIILRPDGTNGNAIRYGGNGTNANVLRFVGVNNVEYARINSSGFVGIGTTNPARILDIYSSSSNTVKLTTNGTSSGFIADATGASARGGYYSMWQGGSQKGILGVSGTIEGNTTSDIGLIAETGGNIRFYTNGSPTEKARLDTSGTLTLNQVQLNSSGYVGLNGSTTYGIGVLSSNRNSGVFDTLESTGSDPLELNYYQGGAVKIGSGTYGSKSLYAVGIYDNGNQVVHAGNVSSYALPLSGGTLTGNLSLGANALDTFGRIRPYGVGGNSGFTRSSWAYDIFQEAGAWTNPYPDLVLQYHTGVTLAANTSYEGIRFKRDYNDDTLVFQVNGASNYLFKYNWMYTNTNGFYSDTNSWQMRPNSVSSYASQTVEGSRNGYGGIYDVYSGVADMWDSGGNGGWYREASGLWYVYWNNSTTCLGVDGSSTSSSYSLYVSGNIYSTGTITAASDARHKDNVVTIENALDKVLNLRGVTFTWNNKEKTEPDYGKTEMGVIAQEVEKVVPEVVTHAKDIDEYAVSYGSFAGLFIEAFKEQTVIINNLKAEIEQLKAKLGE